MRMRTIELMALTTCLLLTAPGCDRAISAPADRSRETTNSLDAAKADNTLTEAAMPEEAPPPSGRVEPGPSALEPAAQPDTAALNNALEGVVAMLKAGVEEDVLLKHIGNSPDPFNVGSAEIIYLTDLGASGAVIKAMMDRDQQLQSAQQTASTATQASEPWPPAGTVAEVPSAETSSGTPTVTDEGGVAEAPAEPVSVGYFYSYLAPYGTWIDVPGYGLCWQPTVGVSCPGWIPYGNRGRWVYSNYGWYWYSDYTWGWAAFHYGRWFHHVRWGWCWVPGTVWGPSWVSWRYAAPYCGWAPLPPYSSSGVYFSIGISWGIPSWCYTYIPSYRICAISPCRYAVPYSQARHIHHRSRISNHYTVGANSTIENLGIPPAELTADPGRDIRRAEIRDRHDVPGRGGRRERLDNNNHTLTVFRPQRIDRTTPQSQVPRRGEPRSVIREAGIPSQLDRMPSHGTADSTPRGSSRSRPGLNSETRGQPRSGIAQTGRSSIPSRVIPTDESATHARGRTEQSVERPGAPRSHLTPQTATGQPVGTSTSSRVNPRESLIIRGRQELQRPSLGSSRSQTRAFDRSATESRSIRLGNPKSQSQQPGSPSVGSGIHSTRPSVTQRTVPAARSEARASAPRNQVRPVEVPRQIPAVPPATPSRPTIATPRRDLPSTQRRVPPVRRYEAQPAPGVNLSPSPRPTAPSFPQTRSFSAPSPPVRSAPVAPRPAPGLGARSHSPPSSVHSAPPSTSRSAPPGRSSNRAGGHHR